jgi:hypothetical protein
MKKILFFCLFVFMISGAFASHISGGEMSYIYLGPGTNPGTLKYQVTLKMYKDCASATGLDATVLFSVYNTASATLFLNLTGIPGSAIQIIQKSLIIYPLHLTAIPLPFKDVAVLRVWKIYFQLM